MKNLQAALQSYLDRIGRLGAHLGSERPVVKEDSLVLAELLAKQVGRADYLIVLALVVLFVSYGLAVFVVLYVRHDPLALKGAFGALLVFTIAVVKMLRGFWSQKSVMNVLIVILNELSPEDAATVVDALYWKMVTRNKRKS